VGSHLFERFFRHPAENCGGIDDAQKRQKRPNDLVGVCEAPRRSDLVGHEFPCPELFFAVIVRLKDGEKTHKYCWDVRLAFVRCPEMAYKRFKRRKLVKIWP